MKHLLLLAGIILFLSSCDKKNNDDSSPDNSIYGRYTGTFNRTGMDTVQVGIGLLSNNKFEGSPGRGAYPAICSGDFTFDGDILSVNDTCTWVANFDWTLIFDGNYNVSFTGLNSVRIWRTNGTSTDEYLLNRLVR